MKKLFAALLAVMMVVSMATVVSAENTTTLTTTVPDAIYTLNIPADQKIEFGTEEFNLDEPYITGASGFAVGKNILVDFTYTAFTCPDVSTQIPIKITYLNGYGDQYSFSRDAVVFKGKADGGVDGAYPAKEDGTANIVSGTMRNFVINIDDAAWGKALGGQYSATITFNAEIVAG